MGGPFCRVFGLTDTAGLGELLLLSEVDLSLLVLAGGIFDCRKRATGGWVVFGFLSF